MPAKTKYDNLITEGIISASELEMATLTARRKKVDIEDVLLDELHVNQNALGNSLANFFGVPYEPYKWNRDIPSALLKNLKREYVELGCWVPIDESPEGLVILTPDPAYLQASRVVITIYPNSRLIYKVCSHRQFNETLDLFFNVHNDKWGREKGEEKSPEKSLLQFGE